MLKKTKKEIIKNLEIMNTDYRTRFIVNLNSLQFKVLELTMAGFDVPETAKATGVKRFKVIETFNDILKKINKEMELCH